MRARGRCSRSPSFPERRVVNLAAKLFALDPSLSPAQVIRLIKQGATTTADGRRHLVDQNRSIALLRQAAHDKECDRAQHREASGTPGQASGSGTTMPVARSNAPLPRRDCAMLVSPTHIRNVSVKKRALYDGKKTPPPSTVVTARSIHLLGAWVST